MESPGLLCRICVPLVAIIHSLLRPFSVLGKVGAKALSLALSCLLVGSVFPATLVWDPNIDSVTAGYRVYAKGGLELLQFDVEKKTNLLLDFVKPGKGYSLYVVAYNGEGIESKPSSPLEYRGPIPFGWPTILAQPAAVTVRESYSALLYVQAAGFGLRFQWLKDGHDLPNATNLFLQIPSVSRAHVGHYSVRVANDLGEIESDMAPLSLLSQPTITNQVRLMNLRAGSPLILSIEAAGTPPLSYRWTKGSEFVQEGSEAELFVPSATLGDAGVYTVVVSNEFGSVSSEPIEVFVEEVQPPDLRIQRSGANLVLIIYGDAFVRYAVESLFVLDQNDWIPIAEVDADDQGQVAVPLTESDAAMQFFRVFELPN